MQLHEVREQIELFFVALIQNMWSIGLKTALVEGDDFASGTSSRSTKLIHGGVRYLQTAILKVR